jgi:hypothetical protein
VAVALHTAWASCWVGPGILELLVMNVLRSMPLDAASRSFAFSFIVLTMVTSVGAVRAQVANRHRLAKPR